VVEAQQRMDGVVVLGAEILWVEKKPEAIKASINWGTLKGATKPVSLALRIAPYPGPFAMDDAPARFIAIAAKSLLEEAETNGVKLSAFQIDFDCAQKNLAGYRRWIEVLRPLIRPVRLVITTLPAWLEEPEFAQLVHDVDGYILQVHSVPTATGSGGGALCDPQRARGWAAKAARLGVPFAVALPTAKCGDG
jgi:hypothetical protein